MRGPFVFYDFWAEFGCWDLFLLDLCFLFQGCYVFWDPSFFLSLSFDFCFRRC